MTGGASYYREDTKGPWERTPKWRVWIGARTWRRRRYASAMIGGGFDGWEYIWDRDFLLMR